LVTDSRHSSVRKVPLSTYGPVYTRSSKADGKDEKQVFHYAPILKDRLVGRVADVVSQEIVAREFLQLGAEIHEEVLEERIRFFAGLEGVLLGISSEFREGKNSAPTRYVTYKSLGQAFLARPHPDRVFTEHLFEDYVEGQRGDLVGLRGDGLWKKMPITEENAALFGGYMFQRYSARVTRQKKVDLEVPMLWHAVRKVVLPNGEEMRDRVCVVQFYDMCGEDIYPIDKSLSKTIPGYHRVDPSLSVGEEGIDYNDPIKFPRETPVWFRDYLSMNSTLRG